jgi:hypothetical protein
VLYINCATSIDQFNKQLTEFSIRHNIVLPVEQIQYINNLLTDMFVYAIRESEGHWYHGSTEIQFLVGAFNGLLSIYEYFVLIVQYRPNTPCYRIDTIGKIETSTLLSPTDLVEKIEVYF